MKCEENILVFNILVEVQQKRLLFVKNLPQMAGMSCGMVSMVRLNTSLVADTIQPDLFLAVDFVVAEERIRCGNFVEKTTRIDLEAVVVAAAVAGSLSNFDFLEFFN